MKAAQRRIGDFPEIGFKVLPLVSARRLIVGDYLLDYELAEQSILITSIRHGRQSDTAPPIDDDFDYEDDSTFDPTS